MPSFQFFIVITLSKGGPQYAYVLFNFQFFIVITIQIQKVYPSSLEVTFNSLLLLLETWAYDKILMDMPTFNSLLLLHEEIAKVFNRSVQSFNSLLLLLGGVLRVSGVKAIAIFQFFIVITYSNSGSAHAGCVYGFQFFIVITSCEREVMHPTPRAGSFFQFFIVITEL